MTTRNRLLTISVTAALVAANSAAGYVSTITVTVPQLAAIAPVSTTAASTGVKLWPAEAGAVATIANDGANTLTVYPGTGATIDGAASVSIATTKRRIFVGISPTVWVSLLGA